MSSLEVAPNGHAEVTFYFGGPCRVATAGGWQVLPSPYLVGLLRQPARLRARGWLELLGSKRFLWAVFGRPGQAAGAGVRGPRVPTG